jgi:hypothetical protein
MGEVVDISALPALQTVLDDVQRRSERQPRNAR